MIPKIVHYCWFGGNEMPPLVKWCMKSWKKHLPDYTFKLWNETNFDVNSVPFVKEAYEAKKYAFVADYVRLYALYTEGGIYLDSDVRVLKSLDCFLKYDFVSSHEFYPSNFKPYIKLLNEDGTPKDPEQFILGLSVSSTTLFACKGLPLIKDCMDFYHDNHFLDSNGKPRLNLVSGFILSKKAEKYGYRYTTKPLELGNNMEILDIYTFVMNALFLTSKAYTIHLSLESWRDTHHRLVFRKYPAFEYRFLLLKGFLRKIKRLGTSAATKKEIYGDWF